MHTSLFLLPGPRNRLISGSMKQSCARCRLRSYITALETLRRPNRGATPTTSPISLRSYAASRATSAPLAVSHRRNAHSTSPLISSTAINAQKQIPRAFRPLHAALEQLKKDAGPYTNISRLQLALFSLESAKPVIRIAVLSTRGSGLARHVTRLLLANPQEEAAAWEDKLVTEQDGGNKSSVLLRFGGDDRGAVSAPKGLIDVLSIPSRILEQGNVEIMVDQVDLQRIGDGVAPAKQTWKESILLPTAETPRGFNGSVQFVTYPVHCALIVAEGMQGALAFGKYMPQAGSEHGARTIKFVLDAPQMEPASASNSDDNPVSTVDILKARKALSKFRRPSSDTDTAQSIWRDSGFEALSEWFQKTSSGTEVRLAPAIQRLIEDVLDEASKELGVQLTLPLQSAIKSAELDTARLSLDGSLKEWAVRAHTELRDKLDVAFSSAPWEKLKWWRLLWRVDDVGMFLTDLLDRSWLLEAEKEMIYLLGRGHELQLLPASATSAIPVTSRPAESLNSAALLATSDIQSSQSESGTVLVTDYPWASHISGSRLALKSLTIPPLQALAQALLIQTFSITTVATALSALLYVSFTSLSFFQAGSVAAFGIVYALRRMQRKWEGEKEKWQQEVKEGARLVLKEAEDSVRRALKSERVLDEEVVDEKTVREQASNAVKAAVTALEAIKSSR